MSRKHYKPEELAFQIAPMIDVIFILILFFMVTAGSVKVENELTIKLPGRVEQTTSMPMVDEQMVMVDANGQVSLNDQVFDNPANKEMPALKETLARFKELSNANKAQCLLTISSSPKAKYERIIDVLNVCAAAKIEGVTFTTFEE